MQSFDEKTISPARERRELNIKALNSQQLVLSPSVFLSVLILTDRWEWRNSAGWARRQSGVVSVDVRFSHRWFSKLHNTFSSLPFSRRRSTLLPSSFEGPYVDRLFNIYSNPTRLFSIQPECGWRESCTLSLSMCMLCLHSVRQRQRLGGMSKEVKHQKMLSFQQGQTSPIFPVLQLQG